MYKSNLHLSLLNASAIISEKKLNLCLYFLIKYVTKTYVMFVALTYRTCDSPSDTSSQSSETRTLYSAASSSTQTEHLSAQQYFGAFDFESAPQLLNASAYSALKSSTLKWF